MVIAVVGSGGKTTRIHALAQKYRKMNQSVVVTTTTHMLKEQGTIVTDQASEILIQLQKTGYCMAGTDAGEKIAPLPENTLWEVAQKTDVLLIEADGSRGLPLKMPNETEPVIPPYVDEIHIVVGLSALGKSCRDVIQRYELAEAIPDFPQTESMVTPEIMALLLEKGYKSRLEKKFPNAKIRVCPSQADSLYQKVAAEYLREDRRWEKLPQEWFSPEPRLVVCGGGHVGKQVLLMAQYMDFETILFDDRQEFANEKEYAFVNRVICDDYKNLYQYLPEEENVYYVIVTRGHEADRLCLEQILNKKSVYIGMIGSKLKVKNTFELLEKEGYEREIIQKVHAPIGLKIGAQTPAEIAVSILAQIIECKNEKQRGNLSRELLQTEDKGVLCIITKKTGSAPRKEGTMMFVAGKKVMGTIGGGTVEKAVIEHAAQVKTIEEVEYNLSNEESKSLGMICGGTNRILFVPIGE